jgi:hypothetical protein
MSRAAYHRTYYRAHLESRREMARVMARRRRWVRGVAAVICEAVEEARNDKPPFGGLTRAGGGPYSRDAYRGVVTIDRGKRSVNHPSPNPSTWVQSVGEGPVTRPGRASLTKARRV